MREGGELSEDEKRKVVELWVSGGLLEVLRAFGVEVGEEEGEEEMRGIVGEENFEYYVGEGRFMKIRDISERYGLKRKELEDGVKSEILKSEKMMGMVSRYNGNTARRINHIRIDEVWWWLETREAIGMGSTAKRGRISGDWRERLRRQDEKVKAEKERREKLRQKDIATMEKKRKERKDKMRYWKKIYK